MSDRADPVILERLGMADEFDANAEMLETPILGEALPPRDEKGLRRHRRIFRGDDPRHGPTIRSLADL